MNKFFSKIESFLKGKLFCFTPEVMLATFLIETLLAVYVFVRYRMTNFGRITTAILLLLALFQLAEYQVCGGVQTLLWSRIGFVAITLLPILGLHLITLVTQRNNFLYFGYVASFLLIAIFVFSSYAITGAVCTGNYVIFTIHQELAWIYSTYYFGFLLLGLWEVSEKLTRGKDSLLAWMLAGYLSFLLPMGIVYVLLPESIYAIPSILCGFAVIFAFILALRIASLYHKNLQ